MTYSLLTLVQRCKESGVSIQNTTKQHENILTTTTFRKLVVNISTDTFIPPNSFTNLSIEELNYHDTGENINYCNNSLRQKLNTDMLVRRKNTESNKNSGEPLAIVN